MSLLLCTMQQKLPKLLRASLNTLKETVQYHSMKNLAGVRMYGENESHSQIGQANSLVPWYGCGSQEVW